MRWIVEAGGQAVLAQLGLQASFEGALLVLDEIGRGTSTHDGMAIWSIRNSVTGGETFSGLAGGLMREWDYGAPPRDADHAVPCAHQLCPVGIDRDAGVIRYAAKFTEGGTITLRANGSATPAGARTLFDSALLQRALDRASGATRLGVALE